MHEPHDELALDSSRGDIDAALRLMASNEDRGKAWLDDLLKADGLVEHDPGEFGRHLLNACHTGNVAAAKYLLSLDFPNINAESPLPDGSGTCTPLRAAVAHGSVELVDELLKCKANPEVNVGVHGAMSVAALGEGPDRTELIELLDNAIRKKGLDEASARHGVPAGNDGISTGAYIAHVETVVRRRPAHLLPRARAPALAHAPADARAVFVLSEHAWP